VDVGRCWSESGGRDVDTFKKEDDLALDLEGVAEEEEEKREGRKGVMMFVASFRSEFPSSTNRGDRRGF
jgi:hypothetical protein